MHTKELRCRCIPGQCIAASQELIQHHHHHQILILSVVLNSKVWLFMRFFLVLFPRSKNWPTLTAVHLGRFFLVHFLIRVHRWPHHYYFCNQVMWLPITIPSFCFFCWLQLSALMPRCCCQWYSFFFCCAKRLTTKHLNSQRQEKFRLFCQFRRSSMLLFFLCVHLNSTVLTDAVRQCVRPQSVMTLIWYALLPLTLFCLVLMGTSFPF